MVKGARLAPCKSARIPPPLHMLCPGFELGSWGVPWCSAHGGALGEAAAFRGRVVWHGTQPAIIRALYPSCAACCLTQRSHLPDIYITTLGGIGPLPCVRTSQPAAELQRPPHHQTDERRTEQANHHRGWGASPTHAPAASSGAPVGMQEEGWLREFITLRALKTTQPFTSNGRALQPTPQSARQHNPTTPPQIRCGVSMPIARCAPGGGFVARTEEGAHKVVIG